MHNFTPPISHYFKPSQPGMPGAFYLHGEWFMVENMGEFVENYVSREVLADPYSYERLVEETAEQQDRIDILEQDIDDWKEVLEEVNEELQQFIWDAETWETDQAKYEKTIKALTKKMSDFQNQKIKAGMKKS